MHCKQPTQPNGAARLALSIAAALAIGAAGWWAGTANSEQRRHYRLYQPTLSRGPITAIGFAYYPGDGELRIRAIVGGRNEVWGIYTDKDTIGNLLLLLQGNRQGLYALFDNNDLIAIYRE